MTKPTRHRITLPPALPHLDSAPLINEIHQRLDEADAAMENAVREHQLDHPQVGDGAVQRRNDRQHDQPQDRPRRHDSPTNRPAPLASLLLVVSAQSTTLDDGRWQFSIETAGGESVLEADDRELGDLNRLTLLAAVRGLEAIDGSASVTLLSHNRYLIRSLTDSLPRWRRSDFVWDHFGRRVEVQHADLWRRIDHALGIHEVQACLLTARMVSRPSDPNATPWLRTDSADPSVTPPASLDPPEFPFTHRSPKNTASQLNGTHRLRDWVLQSAVNAKPR